MKKSDLYQILTGVFVGTLLISNILASKTFAINDIILPSAVIIFPIVYVINDILAEIYGFKKARSVILLGFCMNLFAVFAYNISILLPAPSFSTETAEAFKLVLGNTPRILLASFTAYIIGSLVNAKIMEYLKLKFENKLMFRCVVSTIAGESLDALIFITIAFLGTMSMNNLITMIIAQATFKVLFEVIFYPFTKLVISKVKLLKD